MTGKRTLFDDAMANYEAAFFMRPLVNMDPEFHKHIMEHLQQAVMFAAKYLLKQNQVDFPETNDIGKLIQIAKASNTDIYLTEYVKDNLSTPPDTENNGEPDLKKIDAALKEVEIYLSKVRDNEIS